MPEGLTDRLVPRRRPRRAKNLSKISSKKGANGSKAEPWSVSVADRFYARIVRALGGHARSFLLRDSAPAGLGVSPL